MERRTGDQPTGDSGLTRRDCLSLGLGAVGTTIGLAGLTGSAAAWKRFDAQFHGCEAVDVIVDEDDLRFDPPAVAHVVVAVDDGLDCRVLEFTESAATRKPDRYGDATVVPYQAADGERILGIIEYNYRADRFSEPVCLLRNDEACATGADAPNVRQADCVQAGQAGYWDGDVRECWFDPIQRDAGGSPDDDSGDDDDDDDDDDDTDGTEPRQVLTAADQSTAAEFGTALRVSKDGSVLLVGAPGATVDGVESGAVYVFRPGADGWSQTGRIVPDNPTAELRFGASVDLTASGDAAIVGAPGATGDGFDGGAASLYSDADSGWTRTARFDGSRFEAYPRSYGVTALGEAVALDDAGETAVLGAPHSSAYGLGTGLSIVFERDDDGWSTGSELLRPDPGDSQQFGTTVDVAASGDRAVAGAPVPYPRTTNSEGYVGVYRTGDWDPETFLRYDEGISGDTLGTDACCTAACDVLLAGDPGNNDGTTPQRPGRLVSFSRTDDGWTQETVLEASDGEPEDWFGTSVAITPEGTHALVSAPGSGASRDDYEPAVYALRQTEDGWTETAALTAPTGGVVESFGTEICVDSQRTTAVVGSPDASVEDGDGGAVFVYGLADGASE